MLLFDLSVSMQRDSKTCIIVENYEDTQPDSPDLDEHIYLPHRGRRINKIQPISKSNTPSLKAIEDAPPRTPSRSLYSEKSKGCLKSSKVMSSAAKQSRPPELNHKEAVNSEIKSIKFSEVINDVFIYMIEEKYKDFPQKKDNIKQEQNKQNQREEKYKPKSKPKPEMGKKYNDQQCLII